MYSKFEQSSVIKVLVSGKYKQSKIYTKMFDVYREVYLNQNIFTSGLSMNFLSRNWVEKERLLRR